MHARALGLALAASLALAATAATASKRTEGDKPGPPSMPVASANAPQAYTILKRGPIKAPAGRLTSSQVFCRSNKPAYTPMGGGAYIQSTSPLVSLSSSYPDLGSKGWGWFVGVVNASSAPTTFSIYVICWDDVFSSSDFKGSVGGFSVAPHTLGNNSMPFCDSAEPVIGAGAHVDGAGTQATLHELRPLVDVQGLRTGVNNNSGATLGVDVRASCASDTGAHVVVGSPVTNPAGTQTGATVMCDTGVPIAGGIGASSGSRLVSINSSIPITGGWQAYENNASAQSDTVRAYVICSS
jgi:hypothetical protein